MKQYVVRDPIPKEANKELEAYPELLRTLLYYRGMQNSTTAEAFLNPNFESQLHDPYLMKDMDKAVERILRAISNKEKIIVYSDYDADGVPGAVVMHDFLKKIGYDNFEVYIPHRHLEGYGLHSDAITLFKEHGASLVITIDCGITDLEEVAHANSLGLEVIVTDHHLPGAQLPDAYAILNSKQADCNYPYKMLCGSGVIFKLVQAILQKNNFGIKDGSEKWLLDMVGVATCADMVPLDGENRALAYYGLKVLRKSPRLGLMKLLRKMKVSQAYISEDDIGFMLAPRINAASRMGVPMDAFRLLTATTDVEAGELTEHLHSINEERKGIVASIVKEIHKRIEERQAFLASPVLVMGNPAWKPSILGLAANTLLEHYERPVFLWGRESGVDIKGSCRSDGSVDVVELMGEVSQGVFTHFGGHSMSGGFAVSDTGVHHLEEELSKAYEKKKREKIVSVGAIDARLSLDQVDYSTYRMLEKMMPFGVGNEKPVFLFENVRADEVRQFGKKSEHLELVAHTTMGDKISAIGFFMTPDDLSVIPSVGSSMNLVGSLEKSMFGGRTTLRLRIVDTI